MPPVWSSQKAGLPANTPRAIEDEQDRPNRMDRRAFDIFSHYTAGLRSRGRPLIFGRLLAQPRLAHNNP